MQITSKVETVTPEIAEKILEASKEQVKNRHVMDRHVEWLAEQMRSGKWKTNGEPIILDDEGCLLDGQHRLWAVTVAGVSIETMVTRGVDRATFATIDTGATRKAADVLSILGETNVNITASVLGWLHRHEQGKMLHGLKQSGFTSAIAAQLLRKHSGIHDHVAWSSGTAKANVFLRRIPASALAFLRYVFAQHKPQKALEFFDLVGDVMPDSPGTATRVLRDWILKNERSRCPASTIEYMAVLVKAWRAYLNGETPKTYVWRRTGPSPEGFPPFPGERDSRGKAIRGFERKDKAKAAI